MVYRHPNRYKYTDNYSHRHAYRYGDEYAYGYVYADDYQNAGRWNSGRCGCFYRVNDGRYHFDIPFIHCFWG
jgi:hypothetical protein